MKIGNSDAGTSPKKRPVQILLIQAVDGDGQPIPGEVRYAVATLDIPPKLLFVSASYDEAVAWAAQQGLALSAAPQP